MAVILLIAISMMISYHSRGSVFTTVGKTQFDYPEDRILTLTYLWCESRFCRVVKEKDQLKRMVNFGIQI